MILFWRANIIQTPKLDKDKSQKKKIHLAKVLNKILANKI